MTPDINSDGPAEYPAYRHGPYDAHTHYRFHADATPEQPEDDTFYLLVCRLCGDPKRPLPIPFESAAARGKWASEHTTATGHDSWIVLDQPKGASGDHEG